MILRRLPSKYFINQSFNMSVFTQVLNPIAGKIQWNCQSDEYDYHQEIANAGFGDMLHDKERNEKYYNAIRHTIDKMHKNGQEVHVLDIGTGTGILSMMAVRAGAETVTACEAFLPMANCAEQIIHANGMRDKIQLIKKRSTEIKIGEDMPRRANLLVAELLDTELIGEGAISIYNHAHTELLTDNAVCIPAKARCYAQLAQSPLASQWDTMKILADLDGNGLLNPPKQIAECKGSAELHDIQLSQLPLEQLMLGTDPLEIFEFDFTTKQPRPTQRQRIMHLQLKKPISTDVVFYWWDILMDMEGSISLTCAPFWAHPDFKALSSTTAKKVPLPNVVPWRDHWMQALYYIPKPIKAPVSNEVITLCCYHDEYSLWFDALPGKQHPTETIPRHCCDCGLHNCFSRTRIAEMNDSKRNKRYLRYLESVINSESRILVLGNGCLTGLSAAKLGAASVIVWDGNILSRRFMKSVAQHNNLEQVEFINSLDSFDKSKFQELTHVFGEPSFLTSILPWDNFHFGTLLAEIKSKLSPSVQISPQSACIKALPVQFLDLHKIRTPVKECEGFDLTLFDRMVEVSSSIAQAKVEAQPLWEYPSIALAQPQTILEVNFQQFGDIKVTTETSIAIESAGSCNGIALWVDWSVDGTNKPNGIVSSGPTQTIIPGEFVKWYMFARQGVHLMGKSQDVQDGNTVNCKVSFNADAGDIKFIFDVSS